MSRSVIRFVRWTSFNCPPCRLTVVYVRTISTQTGAVDVGDLAEIEQNLHAALLDQGIDLVLQRLVALAERDLALQVENGHVIDDPFLDVHCDSSSEPALWRPASSK